MLRPPTERQMVFTWYMGERGVLNPHAPEYERFGLFLEELIGATPPFDSHEVVLKMFGVDSMSAIHERTLAIIREAYIKWKDED